MTWGGCLKQHTQCPQWGANSGGCCCESPSVFVSSMVHMICALQGACASSTHHPCVLRNPTGCMWRDVAVPEICGRARLLM
jgi:hypothetical protein